MKVINRVGIISAREAIILMRDMKERRDKKDTNLFVRFEMDTPGMKGFVYEFIRIRTAKKENKKPKEKEKLLFD